MAFGFYTPPWMQMFGPINRRWDQQADESQALADRRNGGFGGGLSGFLGLGGMIPNGFLGHVQGRNLFGRPMYPVAPGTTLTANAMPGTEDVAAKPPPGYRPVEGVGDYMRPTKKRLRPTGYPTGY